MPISASTTPVLPAPARGSGLSSDSDLGNGRAAPAPRGSFAGGALRTGIFPFSFLWDFRPAGAKTPRRRETALGSVNCPPYHRTQWAAVCHTDNRRLKSL